MGKTATKEQRKKWAKINTARNYKMSHTEGNVFRASDGRTYLVQANGSWKRTK